MTDITELAQREKFEAWFEGAEALPWGYLKNRRTSDSAYQDPDITDMWVAWKAAGAELVEAQERAQRANGHLREQSAEWERKAISNFEDCAEMSARIEELESQRKLAFTASNRWADKFREAETRIAELESKLAKPVLLPKTNGYWTETEKAYEEAITLAKRQIRLAGFRCEGDE